MYGENMIPGTPASIYSHYFRFEFVVEWETWRLVPKGDYWR